VKLWKLGPQKEYEVEGNFIFHRGSCWGFVIRAETEEKARKLAHKNARNEKYAYLDRENDIKKETWIEPKYTYCKEILAEGEEEIIQSEIVSG